MESITISEKWLLAEKIKTHFENKDRTVTLKYTDLMQLFLDFIKLIKEVEKED